MFFSLKTSVLVLYIGISSAILNPALTLAPVLLGGMIDISGLSANAAVMIISTELAATAIAFIPALWWVAKISWRKIATISLLAVTLGNFTSAFSDTVVSLLLVRALTGIFEGTLLILYLLVLAQATKTERMFGSKLAIQMLVVVMGLFLIPYMIALWGLASVYFGLTILTTTLVFAVNLLPDRIERKVSRARIDAQIKLAGFGCLFLLLIFAAGINMVWTYLERIGASYGLAFETIGEILATGVLIAIIGGLGCAAVGKRYGRLVPLCCALLIGILGCGLLLRGASLEYFVAGVLMIAVARVIPLPYLFGCLAVLDVNKRLTILSHVVLSLGMAAGPALAIFLAQEFNYNRILWIGGFTICITLIAVFRLIVVVEQIESTHRH
ncbi:MFS transporter [Arenicella sp.]|nr:MFS transporter [Arenicella sp.]